MDSDLGLLLVVVFFVLVGSLVVNSGLAANNIEAFTRLRVLPADTDERIFKQSLRIFGSMLAGIILTMVGFWINPMVVLAGLFVFGMAMACGVDSAEDARKVRARSDFVPMYPPKAAS